MNTEITEIECLLHSILSAAIKLTSKAKETVLSRQLRQFRIHMNWSDLDELAGEMNLETKGFAHSSC